MADVPVFALMFALFGKKIYPCLPLLSSLVIEISTAHAFIIVMHYTTVDLMGSLITKMYDFSTVSVYSVKVNCVNNENYHSAVHYYNIKQQQIESLKD